MPSGHRTDVISCLGRTYVGLLWNPDLHPGKQKYINAQDNYPGARVMDVQSTLDHDCYSDL